MAFSQRVYAEPEESSDCRVSIQKSRRGFLYARKVCSLAVPANARELFELEAAAAQVAAGLGVGPQVYDVIVDTTELLGTMNMQLLQVSLREMLSQMHNRKMGRCTSAGRGCLGFDVTPATFARVADIAVTLWNRGELFNMDMHAGNFMFALDERDLPVELYMIDYGRIVSRETVRAGFSMSRFRDSPNRRIAGVEDALEESLFDLYEELDVLLRSGLFSPAQHAEARAHLDGIGARLM